MNVKKSCFFGAIISSIISAIVVSSTFAAVIAYKGKTTLKPESFESEIKNEPPLEIESQFHLVSSEPNQITKARMLFTGIDHSQQSYSFDEKIELKSQC
ncbi:hypothetical protein CGI42_27815, partial [Vibrio parahaemolyticus]